MNQTPVYIEILQYNVKDLYDTHRNKEMLPGRIFAPLEHICQLDVCLNRNPTEEKQKEYCKNL